METMLSCILRVCTFILCLFSFRANAQFTTAEIGVNGLTCSMCSKSVEAHLRKLDFVANVQMDLQHTQGVIIFAKDKKINMDKVAQAVADAGFSVRFLKANFHPHEQQLLDCLVYAGDQYVVVQKPEQPGVDSVSVHFLGKSFMTSKEYKQWAPKLANPCGSTHGSVYYIAL